MNDKEIEHTRLVVNLLRAKNDAERDVVRKKIAEFERKNQKLVDDIQRRRWTAYGS